MDATVSAVVPDPVSDQVAATAAEFRVDESGAATYSIPLYGVPGTAGVSPKLSLSYSSQGGYGPLGKGWSISGLSSISRCRATREAGDFISGGAVTDGNPAPINYTSTDRYCLDGQRLLAVANTPACAAAPSGLTAQQYRTEIESFQRVCAYTGSNGPAFFTVERKDGSISWYGDRVTNAAQALSYGGYFNSTAPGKGAFALSWAQTRFQDSTGNYIDFVYLLNPAGSGTGEQLINEIRYTGKTVLAGQSGSAQLPYAKLMFTYSARTTAQMSKGYASGGPLSQTRRLDGITSCATAGTCSQTLQSRYYRLNYGLSISGSGLEVLNSLQECRDNSTSAICLPPTTFGWSQAKYEFATRELPPDLPTGSASKFEGFKMGDVDGDGRQDIVYSKTVVTVRVLPKRSTCCTRIWIPPAICPTARLRASVRLTS